MPDHAEGAYRKGDHRQRQCGALPSAIWSNRRDAAALGHAPAAKNSVIFNQPLMDQMNEPAIVAKRGPARAGTERDVGEPGSLSRNASRPA